MGAAVGAAVGLKQTDPVREQLHALAEPQANPADLRVRRPWLADDQRQPDLSQSTDRREKFFSYKQIETVEEYVLVAQHAPQITIYRRAENWLPQMLAGSDAIAVFQSIDLSLPLTQIYEGTH